MSRPSRNTDQLLIQAGRKLLPETGIAGLSLRRVAAEAGVNLGMFYYNFKTKRKFTQLVLREIYDEFFRGFSVETTGDSSPMERLRKALIALARFARDNRKLFLMMLHDVIGGEAEAVRFAQENLPRHLAIIAGLIRDCQRQGLIKEVPLPSAIAFLAGSAAVPNIAMGLIERTAAKKPFGLTLKQAEPLLISDAAIAKRVDLALGALAKEGA
ncbi:MAG TPA: TetR family transcriptional regulator [Elusimicrobia bacterium]|nr:TetR family transcriptional regulator [Elusimicrobiota bacterium]HBT60564.1 TetR family transcriptional regulator [Elusimicrobiota bacterium]